MITFADFFTVYFFVLVNMYFLIKLSFRVGGGGRSDRMGFYLCANTTHDCGGIGKPGGGSMSSKTYVEKKLVV
jgi:hypothetical protein